MTRPGTSLSADYFERLYAAKPDPWDFETSPYEQEKYTHTLAGLTEARYAQALEVGCSIGVLTARLAERCDCLLAVDAAQNALEAARTRCRGLSQVTFAAAYIPTDWPDGPFDLILLSEVLYYLSREDLRDVADHIRATAAPGCQLLLVHWTDPTDYPLTGDEAVETLISHLGADATIIQQETRPCYRLDSLRMR